LKAELIDGVDDPLAEAVRGVAVEPLVRAAPAAGIMP
jgi:hypothetical protein